jgi:hypothetical protein
VQAAPSPSHGAPAPSSPAPHIAASTGAVSGVGLEVVLGHRTPYAPDDIPLGGVLSVVPAAATTEDKDVDGGPPDLYGDM